jgi:uncharacterized lipoprotein YddW (UPF0748 family)
VFFCILATAILASGARGTRQEFRGAWVTAWNHGFLTPTEADQTVAAAKAANINALFIQVRKVGDAYYSSSYEPRASNIPDPDFDPLAYIVEKAHSEGIEVHAWINVLRVQSGATASSGAGHVCAGHPEWLSSDPSGRVKSPDGVFLDPGAPEVQSYTLKIVADLLSKYDVDGIHLDYIRYPGREWGYNQTSVDRFNKSCGKTGTPSVNDPQWCDWRRNQVTSLVRKIYGLVNEMKPDVKVTAATIVWGDYSDHFADTLAYQKVYQDWASWMKEGIVDASVPMNYRDESKPKMATQYRRWLDGMKQWEFGRHIYAGQLATQNTGTVVDQLQASRSCGMNGMVCFQFNADPSRASLVAAMRRTVFSEPVGTPSLPWKTRFARAPGRMGSSIP